MLPHSSIMAIPTTMKNRRRTIQVAQPSKEYDHTKYEVYIRELTIDQCGLGCAVWDGAILLARYLHHLQMQQSVFTGKRAMELGAGVALPSFTVGRFAETMVITDYEQDLMDNGQYNLRVNSTTDDDELPEVQSMKTQLQKSIKTIPLDWSLVPIIGQDDIVPSDYVDPVETGCHSMDFIIGSEIMYTHSQTHSDSLTNACDYYLKIDGGKMIFVHSANREGVGEWITRLCTKHGYECKVTPINEESCEWLRGMKMGGEKKVKGFQQRDEDYVLYELTRHPMADVEDAFPAVSGALPTVEYALDESVIRARALDSVDVDSAAAIMNTIMLDASKPVGTQKGS